MEYRRLGKSGLKLSLLSFGSWVTFGNQLSLRESKELMSIAYDYGVNFFDNAETYGDGVAETLMGECLKSLGWQRDSFCISSKVMFGSVSTPRPTQKGLSRKHLRDACHSAMKRLKVDYLDLYYCHRPDPEVEIEEIICTMSDLIHQGKILYWGISEWSSAEISQAYKLARENDYFIPPTMEQLQYNLVNRTKMENELYSLFENEGLGATIWSPLASGLLTGKYNDGIPDNSRLSLPDYEWLKDLLFENWGKKQQSRLQKLGEIASNYQATSAQIAIAWCMKNPHVSSVILGATSTEQLLENLKSTNIMESIDKSTWKEIDQLFPS